MVKAKKKGAQRSLAVELELEEDPEFFLPADEETGLPIDNGDGIEEKSKKQARKREKKKARDEADQLVAGDEPDNMRECVNV
jgi:hypothetical protein